MAIHRHLQIRFLLKDFTLASWKKNDNLQIISAAKTEKSSCG